MTELTRKSIYCFLIVFGLLSLAVAGLEIARIDVRFAIMTGEIATRGGGVFPTVNGFSYADYFSPYVFLSYLTSGGARWLNLWTLALPTMLLGAYTVAMTFFIGEKTRPGSGMIAAAMLGMTWEFWNLLLGFGIDVPVMAAAVTMLYLLGFHHRQWFTAAAFAALLIFSFAIRGPFGLIMPGAFVGGWLLARREWKLVIAYGVMGAAVSVACVAVGIYLIYRQGGRELFDVFWAWQITSRLGQSNYGPHYYFTNAIASFAPVTLFGVASIACGRGKLLSRPEVAGWLGALLLTIIVISIPSCKHLRYIALTLPGFALLAGTGISDADTLCPRISNWLNKLVHLLATIIFPVSLIGLAATAVVGWFMLSPVELPIFQWGSGVVAALLMYGFFKPRTGKTFEWLKLSGFAAIIMLLGVFPVMIERESSREFVAAAESLRHGRVWLYQIGQDHDDLKYVIHLDESGRRDLRYIQSGSSATHLDRMYPSTTFAEAAKTIKNGDVIIVSGKREAELKQLLQASGIKYGKPQSGHLGRKKHLALPVLD
ncbi:MAG: hypothetical protein PHI35_01135 [Victivallaceae bacterium]|nr:hypothetical protein [Victivallaceae bacterium]